MSKRLNVHTSKSQFGDILNRHREARGEPAMTVPETAATPGPAVKLGKSADPKNFMKLTSYIRRDTHQAVKIRLLQEGQGREFSELVQELLDSWLNVAHE